MQEEIQISKDVFRDRFGENPRKDDLTILVPKQDDPTEQVQQLSAMLACSAVWHAHMCPARQPLHLQHLYDLHICCLHSDICVFP